MNFVSLTAFVVVASLLAMASATEPALVETGHPEYKEPPANFASAFTRVFESNAELAKALPGQKSMVAFFNAQYVAIVSHLFCSVQSVTFSPVFGSLPVAICCVQVPPLQALCPRFCRRRVQGASRQHGSAVPCHRRRAAWCVFSEIRHACTNLHFGARKLNRSSI
jgi:hypothetical protein